MILNPKASFTDQYYLSNQSIFIFIISFVVIFTALCLLFTLTSKRNTENIVFASTMIVLAVLLTYRCADTYFCLGIALLLTLSGNYMVKNRLINIDGLRFSKKTSILISIVFAVMFAAFTAGVTVLRYLTYSSPNFDFGIFCNMFYNMKNTLLPYVTSERDGLISHFAVHISPIYYLILPVYAIFSSPITLQIMQALILASGAVPLFMLANKFGFSNRACAAIVGIYALYPSLSGGCFYDIHENMFLTPLLLLLFLAYEKKRMPAVYILSALIMCVKEDAALFIICFALFIIISRKDFIHGAVLCLSGTAYFLLATWIINTFGEGVLAVHYSNFYTSSEQGISAIIPVLIRNPMLVLRNVFSKEKLEFIIQMFLPLCFMPFMTKKLSRLILLIPIVFFNLMTSYQYQYSIYFQYTFASIAFLFYLSLMNLSDIKHETRKNLLPLMLLCACITFTSTSMQRISYLNRYISGREDYISITEALDSIPDDASVCASTFFVPHLAQRDIIYQEDSKHENETEYIVLDMRYETDKKESKKADLISRGYQLTEYRDGLVAILKRP